MECIGIRLRDQVEVLTIIIIDCCFSFSIRVYLFVAFVSVAAVVSIVAVNVLAVVVVADDDDASYDDVSAELLPGCLRF